MQLGFFVNLLIGNIIVHGSKAIHNMILEMVHLPENAFQFNKNYAYF